MNRGFPWECFQCKRSRVADSGRALSSPGCQVVGGRCVPLRRNGWGSLPSMGKPVISQVGFLLIQGGGSRFEEAGQTLTDLPFIGCRDDDHWRD